MALFGVSFLNGAGFLNPIFCGVAKFLYIYARAGRVFVHLRSGAFSLLKNQVFRGVKRIIRSTTVALLKQKQPPLEGNWRAFLIAVGYVSGMKATVL